MNISEAEMLAMKRVRRAGVTAPDSAVLAWFRSVGPQTILKASLKDIVAVACAF